MQIDVILFLGDFMKESDSHMQIVQGGIESKIHENIQFEYFSYN